MTLNIPKPWWLTDQYVVDADIPAGLAIPDIAGPKGFGLVRVWPNGTTSKGWGLLGGTDKNTGEQEDGFMPRYLRDEFNSRRVLYGYNKQKWAFAFIMRSLNVIAIDIDGKNGGLDHAEELLANAPPTLAETSKSGTGYHLFFRTHENWDDVTGYGDLLSDHIGIVQGVDVRSTGCIYHHDTQRWNGREMVDLPKHIEQRLLAKAEARITAHARVAAIQSMDPLEALMAIDELERELAKPIKDGKRNMTLFAIGSQLAAAGIENWEEKVAKRGEEIGLDANEVDRIVANIVRHVP